MGENSKKLALVTGGSRGIGRAICVKLAKEGYDIVFNYNSGEEAANETIRLCHEAADEAAVLSGNTSAEAESGCEGSSNERIMIKAIKADISNSSDCDMLIKEAYELGGRIDLLVNNAGITRDNLLARIKDEDLDAVLNVNLKGTFYMMRGVSKYMLKQKSGRIINMSSVVGIMGNAGQVNYAASKAAVIGMTKSLARELSSRKICVNAIAPGMIETDMTAAIGDNAKEAILNSIPFKEMGKAEDIANLVAFLAGEGGRYITGQVISVDGGMAI